MFPRVLPLLRGLALALGLAVSLPAAADVTIAVAAPHSGPNAPYGEQFWHGAKLAANRINANGGINGQRIRLIKADDRCDPQRAEMMARRVIERDGASAVVGNFCSAATLQAAAVYDRAGVLAITPASTNPTITRRGFKSVLRMCGNDNQQGRVAADFIVDQLHALRVAVLHEDNLYGQGLAEIALQRLQQRHQKVVLDEKVGDDPAALRALVKRLAAEKADAVFFGGSHVVAGPLLHQMREDGLSSVLVSGDALMTDEMVALAGGPQYVKGTLMTFGVDPRTLDSARDVIEEFRRTGFEPEGYTLYAYSSVQAIAAAFAATRSLDGRKAAAWLKSEGVDTVLGFKRWDLRGDLKVSDYVMYRWDEQGNYQQY